MMTPERFAELRKACEGHSPAAPSSSWRSAYTVYLPECLDEIERLHAEINVRCAAMRGELERVLKELEVLKRDSIMLANHRRQLPDALEAAEDHGAEKERAAIAAWLRRQCEPGDACRTQDDGVEWVADAIERGEHVK